MLFHKDGCLFVEWDQVLMHSMPIEYFEELISSKSLHFNWDEAWPAKSEIVSPERNSVEKLCPTDAGVQDLVTRNISYGHCWSIAEQIQSGMWSDNRSRARQIMIVTDFRSLHDSIISSEVFSGSVAYRRWEIWDRRNLSSFAKKFVKPIRYQDEREFRLLLTRPLSEKNNQFLKIPIDLEKLIHRIIIREGVLSSDIEKILEKLSKLNLIDKLIYEKETD